MSTRKLSEQLEYFKLDRPSEFMMAEWIRDAKEIEGKLESEEREQKETQHALDCMTTCAAELQDMLDAADAAIKRVSELSTFKMERPYPSGGGIRWKLSNDSIGQLWVRADQIKAALENKDG